MNKLYDYTSRTGYVLPQQLQCLWRYVMVLIATFLLVPDNSFAQTITVDGNPSDWATIYNSSNVTVKSLKRDANDFNDNQFTQGSQDRDLIKDWTWNNGNTNDKGDISNAGAALIGCNLYFFGDRTAINGDAQIGFWFFKDDVAPIGSSPGGFSGQHQVGDLLILTHFTNGGGTPLISIYEWVGSGGSHGELNQLSSSSSTGMVNNQLYPVPTVTFEGETWSYTPKSGGPGYVTGSFFEGSVDLCALFGRVPCYSSFLLETRNAPSLNSLQASLQDLVAGNFDITPSVNVNDQVVCEGGTATFTATAHGGIGTLQYSWKIGNGSYSAYGSSNTLTINNVTNSMNDTKVYVKVKGENGCESTPDEGNLIVNPAATANAGADIPVCASDIALSGVALSGSFGGGASSGSWSIVTGGGSLSGNNYVPSATEKTAGATVTLRYTTNDPAGPCLAAQDDMQIVISPAATANAGADQTICEGQTIQLNGSVSGGTTSGTWTTTGTGTFDDATKHNAVYTPSAADIQAGTVTLRLTSANPEGPCVAVHDEMVITINKCSKIKLEKLTNGVVDPTKTWSFTISGGDLTNPVTQTVANDADGILFDNIVLSKNQTYTICETNVASGFLISLEYQGADGIWYDINAYDPNVVNGGGDFNQGEAIGNYCFTIGAGTSIPLPANIYGDNNVVSLRIRINNIPPPGGNARTPGYWKNWNTCTGGNQVQTAAKNGGPAAGVYLLDDHLPHTLWSTGNATATCNLTSFVLTTCNQAVLILDERQNGGKGAKMSKDAAYKLAKHLLAYQLNIKSGTYECTSAAQAAINAEALLAKYCFDGRANSYITNKGATSADYILALEYAKTLDAYNNNLTCVTPSGPLTRKSPAGGELLAPSSDTRLSAYPNPYTDKATIEFTLQEAADFTLVLYDVKGSVVKNLGSGKAKAGKVYSFELGSNNMPEGIYLARLSTAKFNQVVRISLRR